MEATTVFETAKGFLEWLGQGGKGVTFPYGPKGWRVNIPSGTPLEVESDYYAVLSRKPYGAPKIVGYLFPFGGESVCGVISFGFNTDDKPEKTNRRRTTADDNLPEGQMIVGVIEATPDRVEEPSAVTIAVADVERFKSLKAEVWLELYDTVRDGVEREAVMALRRWLKAN